MEEVTGRPSIGLDSSSTELGCVRVPRGCGTSCETWADNCFRQPRATNAGLVAEPYCQSVQARYAAFLRGTLAPFSPPPENPIPLPCSRPFSVPPFPPLPGFKLPRLLPRIPL